MENSNERLDCKRARKIDMVDYLSSLGIEPKKVTGDNYWYLSPLREEKTPSFKVNRSRNIWSDWGAPVPPGKKVAGGNLVDFAVLYHRCSVADFLISMEKKLGMAVFPKSSSRSNAIDDPDKDRVIIVKALPLSHPALLGYLRQRRIPYHIANEHCCEVHFTIRGKEMFAIGFKNDFGGYELRNSFFKGSCSPKGVTHLKGLQPANEICVFEGFFSFLSYLTLVPPEERQGKDMLILNSLSFFEVARSVMERYNVANLFLDNNGPGKLKTAYARSLDKHLYHDRSEVYKGYDDFNHLHANYGRPNENKNRLSP